MDWEYIYSLQADDLSEDEKDGLYNTIAWFDLNSEAKVDRKQLVILFKLSQEVLKYKNDQVETVLHKLDELAMQQAEEDVRKFDSDTDGRSTKSKKSSSIELENLEEKYIELKKKHRKQLKLNEKQSAEIETLKTKLSNLERENQRLINELQTTGHDESHSEASDTKEQYKELVATIQNKNRQISNLLQDIEEVEQDNTVLREKLTNLRDELAEATKELTLLTDNLKACKIELGESEDAISKLTSRNESLQEEVQDILGQKEYLEKQLEDFTQEVNVRVDEWKKILDEKDDEIRQLKTQGFRSRGSSQSTVDYDNERLHLTALNKVLIGREQQLEELKAQLQVAVKEMEESTQIINELKTDKDSDRKKIKNLSEALREQKKLLRAANERCFTLQENVQYAEELARNKDEDLIEIIKKFKEDGNIETSESLNLLQTLKSNNRIKDKQIMDLVKTSNRLQEKLDVLSRENEIMKGKLGVQSDDEVKSDGYTSKTRLQKKEIQKLRRKLEKYEEERLSLKSEIQKLVRTNSVLADQLIDLGVKPNSASKSSVEQRSDKKEMKVLIDENEALRKGLHEILDSLNVKRELKEIKSDTLEKLLLALDTRHVSGWYHPAMRLQAEVHNIQGMNSELREQLRLAKQELCSVKTQKITVGTVLDKSTILDNLKLSDAKTVMEIKNTLQELMTNMDKSQPELEEYERKARSHMQHLEIIEAQMQLLYEEYSSQKAQFGKTIEQYETKCNQLEEINEVNEKKIATLTENISEESLMNKLLDLETQNIITTRRYKFLEKESEKLNNMLENVKNDLNSAEIACTKKIYELSRENHSLNNEIVILNNKLQQSVDKEVNEELQRNLNNLRIKYRNLLTDFGKIKDDNEQALNLLKESNKMLEKEKQEFKTLATDALMQKSNDISDKDIENFTKKLAACEINEMSERQRANHTNHLYELVKEQLQKSEHKFKQYENYNKELIQKNLQLQEDVAVKESQLCNFVNINVYKNLENEYNSLLRRNSDLENKLSEIGEMIKIYETTNKQQNTWNEEKEKQHLHLKHQIVDLQAVSDEKMLIAQLSDDLQQLKMQDSEHRKMVEQLKAELDLYKKENDGLCEDLKKNKEKIRSNQEQFNEKLSLMKNLLNTHNAQYLGAIPVISEQVFIDEFKNMMLEKHATLLHLFNAQNKERESTTLLEHYEGALQKVEKALKLVLHDNNDEVRTIFHNIEENKTLQFNEIKYRRQAESKDNQLEYVVHKIKMQNEQIASLEEELLRLYKNTKFDVIENKTEESSEKPLLSTINKSLRLYKSVETQTIEMISNGSGDNEIEILQTQILTATAEIENKQQIIEQQKSKITELEMSISLFRKQLGDKQSQISFYERHIVELQNKKDEVRDVSSVNDALANEELLTIKCLLKTLQDNSKQKDEEILEYQNLLKEDRDKHSLAATLLQEELKTLHKLLNDEKLRTLELNSSNEPVNKATLEQYITQVHRLEQELSDLHTKYSNANSQLQSSRQEAARWRSLANERLIAMENLSKDLDTRHQNEIQVYKKDTEKWRGEVGGLKEMISKYRYEMTQQNDFQKFMKDKDEKIHELSVMLRQAKGDLRKLYEKSELESSAKVQELLQEKEQIEKELDILKKRFDQLLNKEKSSRDEIRDLKAQVFRRSYSTSKLIDRSDKSIKEHLQRKVANHEKEIDELKESLAKQTAIIESHRIKSAENVDRWAKQKQLQQTTEKLKSKLKAKEQEVEKLQQNCSTLKTMVERFEREKNNLEIKLKNVKCNAILSSELNLLKIENNKLVTDNKILLSKLEMQQHHSGGLGAAMLQEKLEAQERKIAILELSSKSSNEVRAELEKLQETISKLQKGTLRLEAENLELKLDLEKSSKEVPHLKEQIQHLEKYITELNHCDTKTYIEVLKNENKSAEGDVASNGEKKKVSELERTVFVLKRVVEKLQAENKRLLGEKKPCVERLNPSDRFKKDYYRLKEQHFECLQKVDKLEVELVTANKLISTQQSKPTGSCNESLFAELASVKQQLERKSELLSRVKILLQRAAARERDFLQEISQLKLKLEAYSGVVY